MELTRYIKLRKIIMQNIRLNIIERLFDRAMKMIDFYILSAKKTIRKMKFSVSLVQKILDIKY
jgi:hypothetical protein